MKKVFFFLVLLFVPLWVWAGFSSVWVDTYIFENIHTKAHTYLEFKSGEKHSIFENLLAKQISDSHLWEQVLTDWEYVKHFHKYNTQPVLQCLNSENTARQFNCTKPFQTVNLDLSPIKKLTFEDLDVKDYDDFLGLIFDRYVLVFLLFLPLNLIVFLRPWYWLVQDYRKFLPNSLSNPFLISFLLYLVTSLWIIISGNSMSERATVFPFGITNYALFVIMPKAFLFLLGLGSLRSIINWDLKEHPSQ